MLVAGVIVTFMQTGFALLESGSVREKNHQNVLLKNCLDACIGGLVWWAWGFGMGFGDVNGGFIGGKFFFGADMDSEFQYAKWFFKYASACTAASIVSGSVAERININCYLLFSFFMTGFIYPTVVAWTWGSGWLTARGFTDFAGSAVVHMTGGVSGFVAAYLVGPRLGRFKSIREEGDVDDFGTDDIADGIKPDGVMARKPHAFNSVSPTTPNPTTCGYIQVI